MTNVIVIQLASLCRHFLTAYGNDWVDAPNLAAFARRAAVFDNHFVSSLPCMPARREIWAGTQEFWWRGWGPLEPWDRPAAYVAHQSGIASGFVTDHYHFFEWGSSGYYADFDGYTFIRGHEFDNWRTEPINATPDWAQRMVEVRGLQTAPYLRNVQDFNAEADFFGPKVMQATADWIDANANNAPFYLHVDCFDVHEPFHIPEPYRSMYTDDDYRKYNPWPRYGPVDSGVSALSAEEIAWVRAQFAGKLTMVDRWFGRVVEALERTGRFADTCIIVTTDHGHYLGDHGWMGKPPAPLYDTLCRIPLLVWHPNGAYNGQRVSATTQTLDIYATVLDALGCSVPDYGHVHSRSLLPVILGQAETHRDCAIYGYSNRLVGITADGWTLLRDHDNAAAPASIYTMHIENTDRMGFAARNQRRFEYPEIAPATLAGVEMPVWRRPVQVEHEKRPDLLFHTADDPLQMTNLAGQHPQRVSQLEELLRAHMRAVGAPEAQFARLGLG